MLRFFSFLTLLFCFTTAAADIGETYEMLIKREQLLKENELLLNGRNIDSLSAKENSRYIENLHIISLIDEDIFKSQKETVDRLSGTSGYHQLVNRSIALFSFLLAFLLAVSLYMLYLMNKKLNKLTGEEKPFSARARELFSVMMVNFQPAKAGNKEVTVNRLIILGMVFMFISFLGLLLKTLGV
ncbi:MAG: hypothetical protein AB7G44_07195 [Bacteroidia bacterium]